MRTSESADSLSAPPAHADGSGEPANASSSVGLASDASAAATAAATADTGAAR